jgi:hypothetical protein
MFVFHDSGILQVVDTETGEMVKRQRTAARSQPYASPLLAGEHLYMPLQEAAVAVYEANEGCAEVAVNTTPDGLPLLASVVPAGEGRFVFRSDRHLFCVGPTRVETVRHAWQRPDDYALVNTREPYNIEAEKGWSRRYLLFLTDRFDHAIHFLLMPYQSVITAEQTEQSSQIMHEHKARYDELVSRYKALREEELRAPASELPSFDERYRELEAATETLNNEMRILVKNLFSEAQMQQHLDDAKVGKAHLRPGETAPAPPPG